MKKFKDLTPEESIGLDWEIYKNALQLKKDAELIAKSRKSFSSATSLLILSSEESIKSSLIKLHSEKFNIYKLNESHKFFFDHKIRHQIAQLIELGAGITESLIKYDDLKPSTFLKTNINWLNNIVNGFIDIVKASEPLIKSSDRIQELQLFNNLKNKGFYVDYKDQILLPKDEITESTYLKTLLITNRAFKFNKTLRILFHEKLSNHIDNETIQKGKKLLENIINDGMKDFSFKELSNQLS